MAQKIKKIVLPVGGLGTRFLPATKSLPKEMLPIASKPLVQHAFEEAMEAGIEEFIFITGRNKNAINNHFDHVFELEQFLNEQDKKYILEKTKFWLPESGNIVFIRQQQPLGLGHAIWCARNLIQDEYFAVILPDELFIPTSKQSPLKQMIEAHNQLGGNVVSVAEVDNSQTSKYGVITPTGQWQGNAIQITDMVEKPEPSIAPSNLTINGRYILHSSIFETLANTAKGKGGEIQLTDAMKVMLSSQKFYGYKLEGQRLDCGTPIGLFEANIAFGLNDPNMKAEALAILKNFIKNLEQ